MAVFPAEKSCTVWLMEVEKGSPSVYWTVFRMLWKALAFSGVFKETRLYLSQIVPPLAQRRMRISGASSSSMIPARDVP